MHRTNDANVECKWWPSLGVSYSNNTDESLSKALMLEGLQLVIEMKYRIFRYSILPILGTGRLID